MGNSGLVPVHPWLPDPVLLSKSLRCVDGRETVCLRGLFAAAYRGSCWGLAWPSAAPSWLVSHGQPERLGLLAPPHVTPGLPPDDARVLAEILERVKREYVEPVVRTGSSWTSCPGDVGQLDPHSQLLDPREFEEIRIQHPAPTPFCRSLELQTTMDESAW